MEDANDLHRARLLENPMNHLEAGDDSVPELRVIGKCLAHIRVGSEPFDSIIDLKSDLAGFDQVALFFNLFGQVLKVVGRR